MPATTAPTTTSPIVIVPCSKGKAIVAGRVEAQDLYVGPYHKAAMRAARRITSPERIFILSAYHGLLRLTDLVESYDMKLGDEGCVTAPDVAQQVEEMGLDAGAEVVILAGGAYRALLEAVFSNGRCPFAGEGAPKVPGVSEALATPGRVRGIGDHLSWFKRKRRPLAGAQGGRRRRVPQGARLPAVRRSSAQAGQTQRSTSRVISSPSSIRPPHPAQWPL